jgi:hypothetical protein
MNSRLSYVYVRLLFVLEAALFAASVLLHVSLLFHSGDSYAQYAVSLFRYSVVIGLPACAFIKDSGGWVNQIKSCPKWMWKAALTPGVYSLLLLLKTFLSMPTSDLSLLLPGFPLGFDAINICVLYSVLASGYLDKSMVVSRTLRSLLVVSVIAAAILAYHAGYFHHPNT